jgi:hypothetical protein
MSDAPTYACAICSCRTLTLDELRGHYRDEHPETWLGKRAAKEIQRAQREIPKT